MGGVITFTATTQQAKPLALDESLKELGTAINGNVFEVGKRDSSGRYESYEYEAFHSDDCSIYWRETHAVYDAGRRTLLEVQDVAVALLVIRPGSIETNELGTSGHLVSFQTQKLEPGITARVHSTFEDGNESKSTSIQTGYGFYFSDGLVAQKVAKALISAIRSCSKTKSA